MAGTQDNLMPEWFRRIAYKTLIPSVYMLTTFEHLLQPSQSTKPFKYPYPI